MSFDKTTIFQHAKVASGSDCVTRHGWKWLVGVTVLAAMGRC